MHRRFNKESSLIKKINFSSHKRPSSCEGIPIHTDSLVPADLQTPDNAAPTEDNKEKGQVISFCIIGKSGAQLMGKRLRITFSFISKPRKFKSFRLLAIPMRNKPFPTISEAKIFSQKQDFTSAHK